MQDGGSIGEHEQARRVSRTVTADRVRPGRGPRRPHVVRGPRRVLGLDRCSLEPGAQPERVIDDDRAAFEQVRGAIDELQSIVAGFDADSARNGLSEEQGIARLSGNSDEFVQERGLQMNEIVRRLQKLSSQNAAMATPKTDWAKRVRAATLTGHSRMTTNQTV